ncbi:TPA: baseplate J/gp47 family protein [Yersinia enterocolitica]|uniref:baseplate J/gp47 family protein n=1 Tax=Yersinia enterocolitica TaxID=630 RepID=UPI00092D02B5|nr:baseplate J/gp47 family protein [Yersinia enterocolitica]HDL6511886.1 baseplate J/gp47 family protein [Yersinia enterocolitica]HDL7707522.1 baseplate J/gp47 family protein [Yersinia enterocolitica]HDL7835769.1 baseplate J/gp47 family protein [Yersinia enterocolitica]HDL8471620.1 baseplate J/gp47 family protein [Yersinia enterocolitica]HDL8488321.1 baseplate J/gp47 family protein [Yersinia enterocolitica]
MSEIPIIMTNAGAQPTPPQTLLANLITRVSEKVPGYTANLPAGLITGLASTAVGALALIDQARVDLINSVSPYGANIPLLMQLGNIYGAQRGVSTNTSVYVVFSGLPGFAIPKGFTVSDGNYQYVVTRDTAIPDSGQTEPVYCLATISGSWAVPEGTVTQVITSVPKGQPVTCTNIMAGLPGREEQSWASYRAQVMASGMLGVQGTPDCLRALLKSVSGVQDNLISYRQSSLGKWVVVVGGGDPYEVAYAIYKSVPDISVLTNDVSNPSGTSVEKKTVSLTVSPDVYQIPYVIPTSQNVIVIITWNTVSESYVDPAGISLAVQQNVADYINAIEVGNPINLLQIQDIFRDSVKQLVDASLISMIDVQIGINGNIVSPTTGSSLVFTTITSQIQVQKHAFTD